MSAEKFYPREENLEKPCRFWSLDKPGFGCTFPKFELKDRVACEGIVDEVCLYIKDKRRPSNICDDDLIAIKINPPLEGSRSYVGTEIKLLDRSGGKAA